MAGQERALLGRIRGLDEVIPRPEDAFDKEAYFNFRRTGLSKEAYERYAAGGQRAWREWMDWRVGKTSSQNPDPLGEGIDKLILFNVEADQPTPTSGHPDRIGI